MLNQQDVEDFKQDFAICMLLGKYKPTEVNAYRGFYIRSRQLALITKQNRQFRLANEYAIYNFLSKDAPFEKQDKEELIFKVLEMFNNLPAKQRETLLSFVKTGDLVKTASALKQNYNTTKANFRHAILTLRSLLT